MPTYDQADKIIRRFGGVAALAEALGVQRITVYRWRGRNAEGLIPTKQIDKIKKVARLHGIMLTPSDWEPNQAYQAADGAMTQRRAPASLAELLR